MSFESYTDCVYRAFCLHPKPIEIIKRKQEIISIVSEYHNFTPNSILYIGFNPAILQESCDNIFVSYLSNEARTYLQNKGVKFNYIDPKDLHKFNKKIEVVVALDEYFTFAETDTEQKAKVEEICNIALEYVITTCKDYKNQEFKDREFSIPALVRANKLNSIYLEFHDHNMQDRNSWQTVLYEIVDNKLNVIGPFSRRAMFFKQLAKFTSDSGAVGFNVHKNLMYKSLIKKNYEHVISIRFEDGY